MACSIFRHLLEPGINCFISCYARDDSHQSQIGFIAFTCQELVLVCASNRGINQNKKCENIIKL